MNKNLKKWITLKKCDNKNIDICFVDIKSGINEGVSIDNFTKVKELKKTKLSDIKKVMLDKIYELSNKQDGNILEKFSFGFLSKKEHLHAKIKNASYYIAANGRIGEATNMIISKENYDKFDISDFSDKFEILFEDVDDIYLYRKNSVEQPGLVLFYYTDKNNIDYYEIESIGFYPERQFIKIGLKRNLNNL